MNYLLLVCGRLEKLLLATTLKLDVRKRQVKVLFLSKLYIFKNFKDLL